MVFIVKQIIEHYVITTSDSHSMEFISVMIHQENLLGPQFIIQQLLALHNSVIIIGNFNCENLAWNCPANNKNDNALLEYYLTNLNFPEEPSYYPTNTAHIT